MTVLGIVSPNTSKPAYIATPPTRLAAKPRNQNAVVTRNGIRNLDATRTMATPMKLASKNDVRTGATENHASAFKTVITAQKKLNALAPIRASASSTSPWPDLRYGQSTATPNKVPAIPKSSHPKPKTSHPESTTFQRRWSAHNTPDTTASASLIGNSSDSRMARCPDGRDSLTRRSGTSTDNTDARAVTDSNDADPVFSILWIVLRLK